MIVEEKTEKPNQSRRNTMTSVASAVEIKVHVVDKVLVKKVAFGGKHKIADRYENEVYTLCEQPRLDIPVYRIKSDDKERTLLKSLLYLLESRISENDGEDIENNSKGADEDTEGAEDNSKEADDDTGDVGRYKGNKTGKSETEDKRFEQSLGRYQREDETGDVTDKSDSEDECGFVSTTNQDRDAHISDTRGLIRSEVCGTEHNAHGNENSTVEIVESDRNNHDHEIIAIDD